MTIREIKATANMDGFGVPNPISGVLFGGEELAHKFIISAQDGAAFAGTVSAKFLRYADDVTVPLTGSIENGKATVTLIENCYMRPGRFKLTVYITQSGSTTAVYCCMGTVDRTDGSSTIDPSGEINLDVTDLINDIAAARASIPADYSDLLAAIAPTYSSSSTYEVGDYVWYDGDLYRCTTAITTSESWTAAHWTAAVFTDDVSGDVAELKSALDNVDTKMNVLIDDLGVALDFSLTPGYIDAYGLYVSPTSDKQVYTSAIPVTAGEAVTIKTTFSSAVSLWLCYATYDSNGDFQERIRISRTVTVTDAEETITIPSGISYIRITYSTFGIGKLTVYTDWETIADIEDRVETLEDDVDSVKKLSEIYFPERIEMVTQNKAGTGPQLANISNYTLKEYGTSYKYYQNVIVDFSQNGSYYMNPVGNAAMLQVDVYNSSDTKVTSSQIQLDPWDVLVRVDDTHVKKLQYTYESNFYSGNIRSTVSYTLSGTAAYLKIGLLKTMSFDAPTNIGVTYNRYSNVYMPYGTNLQYNNELPEGVWDYLVSKNRFYDLPAKRLNPWMQRSYALTNNLLDDRKIDWRGDGNYYKMKPNETVPVTGGKTIMCNKGMYTVKTYDSSGTATAVSNIGAYAPYTLGSNVVAIRFDVWRGNGTTYIPADTYEPIVLYYADDFGKTLPYDNVDVLPLPMAQINGWDINKNVYDYAVPDTGSNIMRMIKTFAIREMNKTKDALRIGTFNLYVNNSATNRPTVKKELETYGLDICCFQEARNYDSGHELNIGDYLKGWQFQYCNTNEGTSSNGRAMVSDLQILSSNEVTFTANTGNSYLKCVIQLPRYKDYADGLTTLSLYTYHGNVSSADTRAAEVTQMLTAIAEDTSDFIIVTGDTNDFSANKDIWAMFNTAGLTPVHNGESETVTARNESIDNIFISEHCSCAYYNVINSGEWMYTPPGGSTPQAVSDHDLLYADIVFDFASAIAARA